MTPETLELLLRQGPYFALLILLGYGFYKFLERTYSDHKEQMQGLRTTFESTVDKLVNRLDRIENTLEGIDGCKISKK